MIVWLGWLSVFVPQCVMFNVKQLLWPGDFPARWSSRKLLCDCLNAWGVKKSVWPRESLSISADFKSVFLEWRWVKKQFPNITARRIIEASAKTTAKPLKTTNKYSVVEIERSIWPSQRRPLETAGFEVFLTHSHLGSDLSGPEVLVSGAVAVKICKPSNEEHRQRWIWFPVWHYQAVWIFERCLCYNKMSK